jgi:hypothetical protein
MWLQVAGFLGGGFLAGAVYIVLAWRAEKREARVTDVTCDKGHYPIDSSPPLDQSDGGGDNGPPRDLAP